MLYWLIDVSIAVSDDHFLTALDAVIDVMVLYDEIAAQGLTRQLRVCRQLRAVGNYAQSSQ